MIKWDGHTHTQFCYHGNDAPLEQYVEQAIALGFTRYSVTEHPPLPANWVKDQSLFQELAMPEQQLEQYFAYVQQVKEKYQDRIEVTIGLELDYLHGRTDYTDEMVSKWGHLLEDVVYSVHYLPGQAGMYCIDFTAEDFSRNLLRYYGTMDTLVDTYFDHVELAIEHASTLNMRKRIGHLNLITKFAHKLPPISETLMKERLEQLLPLLQESDVGVDVNVAGLRVATCEQAYVPSWFIKQATALGIECVYGSDAHKPEQVGLFWEEVQIADFDNDGDAL